LVATDVHHANLSRSDEQAGMVVENDAWTILRIRRHNNRRVQSLQVPLKFPWRFPKQIAQVVDDFHDTHRLSCTSFDQLASTADSNMRAIKPS
jgi:hypothetical protein